MSSINRTEQKELTLKDLDQFISYMSQIDPKFKEGVGMILAGKDSVEVVQNLHSNDELLALQGTFDFINERIDDLKSKGKGDILNDLVEAGFKRTIESSENTNLSEKEDSVSIPELI